jgi:hypothetical protein
MKDYSPNLTKHEDFLVKIEAKLQVDKINKSLIADIPKVEKIKLVINPKLK